MRRGNIAGEMGKFLRLVETRFLPGDTGGVSKNGVKVSANSCT